MHNTKIQHLEWWYFAKSFGSKYKNFIFYLNLEAFSFYFSFSILILGHFYFTSHFQKEWIIFSFHISKKVNLSLFTFQTCNVHSHRTLANGSNQLGNSELPVEIKLEFSHGEDAIYPAAPISNFEILPISIESQSDWAHKLYIVTDFKNLFKLFDT